MTETTITHVFQTKISQRQGVNAVIYERSDGNEMDSKMFPDAEVAIEWIKYFLPYDNYEIKEFVHPQNGRPAIDVLPSDGDYMGTVFL